MKSQVSLTEEGWVAVWLSGGALAYHAQGLGWNPSIPEKQSAAKMEKEGRRGDIVKQRDVTDGRSPLTPGCGDEERPKTRYMSSYKEQRNRIFFLTYRAVR